MKNSYSLFLIVVLTAWETASMWELSNRIKQHFLLPGLEMIYKAPMRSLQLQWPGYYSEQVNSKADALPSGRSHQRSSKAS